MTLKERLEMNKRHMSDYGKQRALFAKMPSVEGNAEELQEMDRILALYSGIVGSLHKRIAAGEE